MNVGANESVIKTFIDEGCSFFSFHNMRDGDQSEIVDTKYAFNEQTQRFSRRYIDALPLAIQWKMKKRQKNGKPKPETPRETHIHQKYDTKIIADYYYINKIVTFMNNSELPMWK